MKAIISRIKSLFSAEPHWAAEERFLSQATSTVDLEHLQREWDRKQQTSRMF